ncbi:protein suppressor of white apricot isoform X2 [Sabethes cyaneus]|nr:protein suppressor of white apricot isoform X2 [Sabethes cyaneus]
MVGPAPADPLISADSVEDENSLDPPFVAPANFEIPSDLVELPETMKEHAIVEKTAKFIASQDSQMEILLRAKQAANPQFDFLNPGGRLYRYYRHVLMAIKTNRYPEEVPEEEANPAADETAEEVPAEVSPVKPKLIIPTIKYKPSVDCAYTQLISKITGAPIPTKADDSESDQQKCSPEPTDPTQLTALSSEFEYRLEEKSAEVAKVSAGLAGLVQYDSDSEDSASEAETKNATEPEQSVPRKEIVFSGLLPPEIFQHVIEKTATYVAKNGYSFEDALRTKNDPRFLFLRKEHEFYPYYAFRVRYLINPYEEVRPKSPEPVTITREIENGTVIETPSIGIKTVNTAPQPVPPPQTQIQATKPGGAVCFSIKSNKDDASKGAKANVVQELGGDEEETDEPAATEKEKSKSPVPEGEVSTEPFDKLEQILDKTEEQHSQTPPPVSINNSPQEVPISRTPPLEDVPQPAPTAVDVDSVVKDQKRMEDRIKDKLAVAARERLAMISKEKQLQLERKRKANAFLSMLQKPPDQQQPAAGTPEPEPEPEPEPVAHSEWSPPSTPTLRSLVPAKNGLELLQNQFEEHETEHDDDTSDLSVHSIPSQSSSPGSNRVPSSADDDVVLVENDDDEDARGRPSRSRTRSRSGSNSKLKHRKKHKSNKSSKSKKSKKKKSRSRSPTPVRSRSSKTKASKRKRSRSRTPSASPQRSSRSRSRSERDAKKKKKNKKKSHKTHKSSRSSSSSRHHHHHHKERR